MNLTVKFGLLANMTIGAHHPAVTAVLKLMPVPETLSDLTQILIKPEPAGAQDSAAGGQSAEAAGP